MMNPDPNDVGDPDPRDLAREALDVRDADARADDQPGDHPRISLATSPGTGLRRVVSRSVRAVVPLAIAVSATHRHEWVVGSEIPRFLVVPRRLGRPVVG